ncbi:hypothetical protein ACTHSO_11595, partial [Neisseria sp. P0009.S004]|uniref:hypothetical protein n=1 Tax=Neisseria sp. P0009.S004 TaxID=3436711 RepID=UPI003F7FCFFA
LYVLPREVALQLLEQRLRCGSPQNGVSVIPIAAEVEPVRPLAALPRGSLLEAGRPVWALGVAIEALDQQSRRDVGRFPMASPPHSDAS